MDSQDTLACSSLTGIRPRTETFPLEKAGEAYAKLLAGRRQVPNGVDDRDLSTLVAANTQFSDRGGPGPRQPEPQSRVGLKTVYYFYRY
jgi:hypothetical protein